MTIIGYFERFNYFTFETNFFEKQKHFLKNWITVFSLNVLRLKTPHFHTKANVKTNTCILRNKKKCLTLKAFSDMTSAVYFVIRFFFHKQHFYKQCQAEMSGKTLSKS